MLSIAMLLCCLSLRADDASESSQAWSKHGSVSQHLTTLADTLSTAQYAKAEMVQSILSNVTAAVAVLQA
jgi:hypothetical protein